MPIIQELLRDDYSFEEAKALQFKYSNLINQSSKNNYIKSIESIKSIVGVDVSYFKKKFDEYGIACAVVWDLNQKSKVNHYFSKDLIKFPYKPGFLGFRECKIIAQVISKLPNKPDLIICDGHGKIHPRRFGEAVHLGYALNIPSIGIAKSQFIGYSELNKIKKIKGKKVPVWSEKLSNLTEERFNELLGYAICLNDNSKPVFVSEGYKINLDLAIKICLDISKGHRLPVPIYQADHLSRKEIKKYI